MTVGERIRNRRQELHLTQQQLADKMGKTRAAICRVEKDVEQNLTLDRVTLFAKALNCSESYLMGWENAPDPQNVDKHIELISLFEQATPEQQEVVMDILRQLVKGGK